MTKDKALEIAIEWMEGLIQYLPFTKEHKATMSRYNKAITAIKETSAQRTWVGLEGEEIRNLWEEATKLDRSTMTIVTSFARAIEAKLKDKNCTG